MAIGDAAALSVGVVIGAAVSRSYLKATETASQKAERLGAVWKETNARLGATGNVIKYKTLLGELRDKQARLGGSGRRLGEGIERVERRYRDARREARAYGLEIGDIARQHDRLGRALKHTQGQQRALAGVQGVAGRFGALRTRMLGLAGVVYGAGRAIGRAMDPEQQGVFLGTVINARDGDRDAAVARARTHARGAAANSLATESEMLEIEYALNSAGLEEDIARTGSVLTHRLATITRGAPARVGEILGITFNNMAQGMEGEAAQKMARIGNVLAKTQFKFQIRDFGQLGESLAKAAPAAVAAKLSLEQTAAAVGILNNAGVQGSEAGTALQAVLRNLTRASDELGVGIVRNEGGELDGELDLVATLGQLREALEDYDVDERNTELQKIFGDEGKRGLVPLIELFDQLETGYAEIGEAARSTLVDDEYRRFLATSAAQWKMFRQNAAQASAVFANTLLPAVSRIGAALGAVAKGVSAGIERYPILGHAIAALAGGFTLFTGALTIGLGAMWARHKAVLVFGPAWRGLGTAIGWTAGRLKASAAGGAIRRFGAVLTGMARRAIPAAIAGLRVLALAAAANPIGLAISAIALGAGLIVAYWTPIKAFFGDLWSGVAAIFEGAAAWLRSVSLSDAGARILDTVLGGMLAAKDRLVAGLRTVFEGIDKLLPFSDAREGPLSSLTASGRSIVTTLSDGVRQAGPAPLRQALGAALAGAALTAAPAATPATAPTTAGALAGALAPAGHAPRAGPAAIHMHIHPGAWSILRASHMLSTRIGFRTDLQAEPVTA